MADLRWDLPETEEVELTKEELADLDKRIEEAKKGPWYTSEEVRAMIPQWISKYATSKAR